MKNKETIKEFKNINEFKDPIYRIELKLDLLIKLIDNLK